MSLCSCKLWVKLSSVLSGVCSGRTCMKKITFTDQICLLHQTLTWQSDRERWAPSWPHQWGQPPAACSLPCCRPPAEPDDGSTATPDTNTNSHWVTLSTFQDVTHSDTSVIFSLTQSFSAQFDKCNVFWYNHWDLALAQSRCDCMECSLWKPLKMYSDSIQPAGGATATWSVYLVIS